MAKVGGRGISSTSTGAPGVLHQSISLNNAPDNPGTEPEDRPSFWEALYQVPEDQWWSGAQGEKGYKAYLYDLEQGGKYLALITHPFDIEWVKEEKGGGYYRAQLNDPSGKITASARFSIDGESKRKQPTNVQNAPPAAVPAQDAFLSQIVEVIRENQRETREILREAMNRDRPPVPAAPPMGNPMDLMKPVLEGVVGMFTSMIPKPGNPLDDLLKLKQLMGEPKDMFSDLTKLKELGLVGGSGGGNGDLLKQLEVVFAVAEKIGISGGGGKSLTEILADKAPDVINAIRGGISEYRALEEKRLETAKVIAAVQTRGQAGPVPSVPQTAQPTNTPARQPVIPATSAPVATQLDVQPIGDATTIPAGAVMAEATEAQINQIKAEIVQAIASNVSGQDLFSFLKIKAPMFLNGMCTFDSDGKVIDVVTEDQLAMFCANDPVLAQAAKFPRYREALRELLEEVKYATMGGENEDAEVR